jgi:hypothetical protein
LIRLTTRQCPSPPQQTQNLKHQYFPDKTHLHRAGLGAYAVTITVTDVDGDSSVASQTITINNTPDAPVIADPGTLRWSELSLSEFLINASDSDAGDTFVFALEDAPAGLTVESNTGRLLWRPTSEQGGRRYAAFVTATDSTGRLTRFPLTLEVQDSGSIHGRVFS